MKNLFLFIAIVLIFGYGCQKRNESSVTEKLVFVDLRQTVDQTPLTIIDDTVSMETVIKFNGESIFNAVWEHGIYSGPIIKTRLLWARSNSNRNFLIVGFDDLFYEKLMVIEADGTFTSHEIGIVKLLDSELQEDETKIWFKYNNSWIRTGKIPDAEMQFIISP